MSSGSNRRHRTLDYLCAADLKTLQKPSPLTWDWMNAHDSTHFDGVVSVNRNTLVNWLWTQMQPICAKSCLNPMAHCSLNSSSNVQYSGSFTQAVSPIPWVLTFPSGGSTVLTLDYAAGSSDSEGQNGMLGSLDLSTSYVATVTFEVNTIIIKQHLILHLEVRNQQSEISGNFFDKTITDTYTLVVTEDGSLTVDLQSDMQDNSSTLNIAPFLDYFTGLNDLTAGSPNYGPTNLTDMPVSFIRNFVFPGGSTLTFKDATFSNFQDLAAHITYCDPAAKEAIVTLPR